MNENLIDNCFDRRKERLERHTLLNGGEWINGVVLVLIGLLLLGQNVKIVSFDNWWALFILLPAFGSFNTAWRMFQAAGHFTRRVLRAAIVGTVLILVTAMFLFEMNWTTLGPDLLILASVGLLINALLPEKLS